MIPRLEDRMAKGSQLPALSGLGNSPALAGRVGLLTSPLMDCMKLP